MKIRIIRSSSDIYMITITNKNQYYILKYDYNVKRSVKKHLKVTQNYKHKI